MFTGLVTDIGVVQRVEDRDSGRLFRIATSYDAQTIEIGASIACNGVCLTVTERSQTSSDNWFEVEAWAEAMKLTNASKWALETPLNLERSLKMGDELGGHMVSGHVDGTARVVSIEEEGEARRFTLELPQNLVKFIVPKGSIALDGTSLTINAVDGGVFDVLLIRHTLEVTTWGGLQVGDAVNVEVDQMARYLVKLIEQHKSFS